MFKSFMRWCVASGTRRALNSLTDYQLKDIGITRGDINNIARDAAEREFG